MNFKAFFILIIILLATLFGVAQEDYVVFEGAEQNYFVENHSGSDYSWRILTSFNPDTEADSNDLKFVCVGKAPDFIISMLLKPILPAVPTEKFWW